MLCLAMLWCAGCGRPYQINRAALIHLEPLCWHAQQHLLPCTARASLLWLHRSRQARAGKGRSGRVTRLIACIVSLASTPGANHTLPCVGCLLLRGAGCSRSPFSVGWPLSHGVGGAHVPLTDNSQAPCLRRPNISEHGAGKGCSSPCWALAV